MPLDKKYNYQARNTGKKPSAAKTEKRQGNTRTTRKRGRTKANGRRSRIAFTLGALMIIVAYVFLFYYFFVGPFSFKWKAMYGDPTYPEGYNVRGIDISHYQKRINWEQLRNESINNDPIRFVFIKATEGEKLMDEDFNENFFQAAENGFIRGAYHFYVPGVDIRRQAQFYLHTVHLVPGDLPPVLDVESTGKLTDEQIRNDVRTWLEIVGRHYGVNPIIYANYKFRTTILDTPEFDKYPLWIAHYYVDKMKYNGKWAFWQHTDCGKLNSINGDVDFNIFNGSPANLQELTIPDDSALE